jgi:non-specific serine/threonine protein kinase
VEERNALTVATVTAGWYSNLAWLLARSEQLTALGFEVILPQQEGKTFTTATGELQLSVSGRGDWLDLAGEVNIGDHRIPFSRFVGYLRDGERVYPLPDGSLFLIPEEWFAAYAPGLRLARVTRSGVRLTRSQAPLLKPMGLEMETDTPVIDQAEEYLPGASLRAVLRPYQLEGVRWLIRHYHERLGACLADDMGLGKTLQTIATLLYAKERLGTGDSEAGKQIDLFGAAADEEFLQPLRALIVLPASLIYNWSNELKRFAPSLTVLINVGTKRERDARILRRYDVLLTTYQTALRDKTVLGELELSYIVLDESQQIKNRQSKVFRAINELAAPHRLSLSGTPIENSLSDLWSQMQFINPGLLGTFPFFRKHFMIPIEQHDDERQKEILRRLVHPHLLRRTKVEVAPDLPDLDIQVVYCEMTAAQRKRYELERSAARNALLGTATPDSPQYKLLVIQTLTRLRQIANHPVIADADYTEDSGKFSEVIEQWDTLRRAGYKVLIFSSMVRQLKLFRRHLQQNGYPYAWLTGSVPSDQRALEVQRFQEDPDVQTFFISIKAGGTGLNLTAADYVFLLDPWWNPTTEDQAIARAHRIGRSGKVIARKFLTIGTLEEKIYRLQQRKKRLAGEIIDKEGIEEILRD